MTRLKPKLTPLGWFRWSVLRIVELALASFAVVVAVNYIDYREQARFEAIPATDWFEVVEVYVPDHMVGSNPNVIYDRVIKESFRGFWVAEVERRDSAEGGDRFFNACTGNGINDYDVGDYLPGNTVSWRWYLDRECTVPSGAYRIVTTYDMRQNGGAVKKYRVLSNVFRVFDLVQAEELPDPKRQELGLPALAD